MASSAPREGLAFGAALPLLLCITLVFFLNFMGRAIFSPLMLSIEQDLGISHAQAGGIFLMVSLGYSLALLLSGFVSSWLTHRRCVIIAAALMGAGLLAVGHAHNPVLLQLALFFFGLSGGLYLPSGIAALTSLVRKKDFGKAIAVHEMAPNLSLILAPLVAEALLQVTTWRGVMNVLGWASLAVAGVYALFGRGGDFHGKAPDFSTVSGIVRMPAFWALGLLFSLAVGASIGPYSMLPLFLVDERGYDAVRANELLAVSRVLTPVAAIAAGWAADRFGPTRTIVFYLASTGAGTILMGLTHGLALTVVVLAQPFFSALYFTAGFAVISRVFSQEVRNVAVSLIIPFGVSGGMGVIPTLLGFCGDHGSFALGFVILGSLLVLGLSLPPLLQKAMERAEADEMAAGSSLDTNESST